VNTGSTARASPALAILATTPQPGLVSEASVQMQTRVVFPPISWRQSGASSIAAISSAVRSNPPPLRRGPAITSPSSPITSPAAFTTATAATVSPNATRVAAYPTPAGLARSRPSTLPTAAPRPAPTRPRSGIPPRAASHAA
jgi:hypothetical protein